MVLLMVPLSLDCFHPGPPVTYKVPLPQEVPWDCSEEPVWLCLDSRHSSFLLIFQSRERWCCLHPPCLSPTNLPPAILSFSKILSSFLFSFPLTLHPLKKRSKDSTSPLQDGVRRGHFKGAKARSPGLLGPGCLEGLTARRLGGGAFNALTVLAGYPGTLSLSSSN